MKITGLITEYNPFHNGHNYHIEEARRLTGADYIVVVMSGDFVQRGAPACMDKYLRTEMALRCGADIVIELPVLFATASAEYFALGAIKLLDSLGIVDAICFGSEVGELTPLNQIADLLVHEPDNFKTTLSYHLQQGDTYPIARRKALLQEFPEEKKQKFDQILASPNNILGVEYLKALKLLNSSIKPFTIQRKTAGYHEQELNQEISSATSIRNELARDHIQSLKQAVPKPVYELIMNNYKTRFPIFPNDFSTELYHSLLYSSTNQLMEFLDMNADLAHRMLHLLKDYTTMDEFIDLLKSKNYTMTRVSRILCHILLRLKQEDLHPVKCHKEEERLLLSNRILPQYIRLIGLKKEASFLLRKKTLESTLPLITKVADAPKVLSEDALKMFTMDINASCLYQHKVFEKYGVKLPGEYKQGILLV